MKAWLVLMCSFLSVHHAEAAEGELILQGKKYILKEAELLGCQSEPEAAAMKFQLVATMSGTRVAMNAKCVANCASEGGADCGTFCSRDPGALKLQESAVLMALAGAVRTYPPAAASELCAKVRNWCTAQCTAAGLWDENLCQLECQQYNIPYKK